MIPLVAILRGELPAYSRGSLTLVNRCVRSDPQRSSEKSLRQQNTGFSICFLITNSWPRSVSKKPSTIRLFIARGQATQSGIGLERVASGRNATVFCHRLDAFKASAPFVAPRIVANLAGSRFVVLATASETNGAYSAFEIFVPPGAGTPLHAHSNQEAVFYVVKGYLRFQAGDAVEQHGPGSLVHAARNVPHLFVKYGE